MIGTLVRGAAGLRILYMCNSRQHRCDQKASVIWVLRPWLGMMIVIMPNGLGAGLFGMSFGIMAPRHDAGIASSIFGAVLGKGLCSSLCLLEPRCPEPPKISPSRPRSTPNMTFLNETSPKAMPNGITPNRLSDLKAVVFTQA